MRNARLSLLVVIVLTLLVTVRAAAAAAVAAATAAADIARNLESEYGIKLLTQPPPPSKDEAQLRVAPIANGPHRNAEQHLRVIQDELARYKPGLLRASGVRSIALVESLANRNEVGLAHVDYHAGVLYWSLGYDSKDDYLRHAVHHELFHAIDLLLHDHLAKDDPAWLPLNDRAFKYGPGGHIVREGFKPDHSDASPGFVSRYARTSPLEDKAETFAKLMRPDAAAWLEQQSKRDPILAGKVKYLRDLIQYHERVDPDDEAEKAFVQFMDLVRRDDFREFEQFLKAHAGDDLLKAKGYAGRTTLQRVIMAKVVYAPQTFLFQARSDKAIDVNAADDYGWTALHTAAWLRDLRSVGALLDLGADPNVKDKQGGTAADWARLHGYGDVLAVMEKHKRDSWKLTPDQRRALELERRRQREEQEDQRRPGQQQSPPPPPPPPHRP
jgi:hypothetical protein